MFEDAHDTRAISFDLWLTLLRSDPQFKPRRNETLRARLAPHLAAAEFDAALRRYDKEADLLAEQSGVDYGFAERLTLLCAGIGVPFDPTSPQVAAALAEQERLALEFHPLPYHSDLPALVRAIATQVPLAVTSNTGMLPGSLMRRLLDMAGYAGVFTHLTFSNEVRVNKPKAEIFAHTLSALRRTVPDLTASQVLHIGDNMAADYEGATAFGMRAALVNSTAQTAQPVEAYLAALLPRLAVPA